MNVLKFTCLILLKDIDVKYGTNNTKTEESGIAVIKNYNDKSKKYNSKMEGSFKEC